MRMFNRIRPCLLCQSTSACESKPLCQPCFDDLPWQQDWQKMGELHIYRHFRYEWPIDRLIHLIKYEHQLLWLAALCLDTAAKPPMPIDALVAVPLSDQRLKQRGFNQALLIAQRLSKLWGIPIWHGATRVRHTLPQQQLTQHERLSNLDHAFAIAARPPQRLLLIDDVCTTGSTLSTLAQLCHQHGCAQVAAWVVASTARP